MMRGVRGKDRPEGRESVFEAKISKMGGWR